MEFDRISKIQTRQKLPGATVCPRYLAVFVERNHADILGLEVFLTGMKLDDVFTAMILYEQTIFNVLCGKVHQRKGMMLSGCYFGGRIQQPY
ncbi:hypothetical protein N8353_10865 [Octadecabacter sp.]|nr:hypothetical protein [Octadecabacter sp.]